MNDYPGGFWAVPSAHQRFLRGRLCLAEEPDDPCNAKIVQAHTIPRSQLKQIAREGHVYSAPPFDIIIRETVRRSNEMPLMKKFGVGVFSTLSCFCGRHDKSIFADIEDVPLTFTPRQLALLHYRTAAGEFYRKVRISKSSLDHFQQFDVEGGTERSHPKLFASRKAYNDKQQIAVTDSKIILDRCAQTIDQHTYSDLSALVIRFKRLPSIMTVGGFYPEFDYVGRRLQQLGQAGTDYERVSFNIMASEGRAAVAVIWRKGHDRCLAFARSYAEQPGGLYTTLAIQTAFEHINNSCANPEWWEGLRPPEQRLLANRLIFESVSIRDRDRNCLQYAGITHDDWQFDTLEFVNT